MGMLHSSLQRMSDNLTYYVNDQNMVMDDEGNFHDLFSFLMMSDPTLTIAELDREILASPKNSDFSP
jgi:hypothetical protein